MKSGGKEGKKGEITRNFISTDFRRKLLRNPRFINKLIIISITHLHPTMMLRHSTIRKITEQTPVQREFPYNEGQRISILFFHFIHSV